MKHSYAILLAGVSALALGASAHAQTPAGAEAQVEEVVVTGSRVIANGNQAPTPVTVLATEKLLETTPTNIPDALNRLPQFAAQTSVRNIGSAGGNNTGNYLNLRRFGTQRNLILVDGSRVPPTASSGAVDTNIIPQGLVQRVEVVTGGASAVYGSDAVTGVVNFVIDRNFNGLKLNSQVGVSTYGDDANWRVGGAWGMPLFDGRGHIEASFDHYDSKGILDTTSRPEGETYATVGGNGSASNPFRVIQQGRVLTGNPGGFILGTAPVGLRDLTFKANGVSSPFIHGDATGVNGLESGGDGAVYDDGTLAAPLRTNQAFARFDYDISDNLRTYIQASYNDSWTEYPYLPLRYVATIASGNPFIPANVQALMTAMNVPFIEVGKFNSKNDGYDPRIVNAFSTNVFVKTGLEGKVLDTFDWNLNYSYSRSTQRVINLNNQRTEKVAAAADAVVDPPTGRIVCAVSLTQYAYRFPGCEPINVFGPTAISAGAYDWFTDDTRYTLANLMHDVNFSVAGSPVSLWAGPVTVAVSGEYRWLSLRNISDAEPAVPPDCTGLRIIGSNCLPTSAPFLNDSTASMYAKQNVKEIAGELLIPLIRDVPFAQSFELNLAGRYTDCSTSGSVETWKVGGTWQVTDEFKIRGTMSRDIRAPTLQDLFAPTSSRPLGFSDLHTNQVRTMNQFSRGNPDLKPEVARTNTLGVVYQPNWAPRLSLAIDYYEISINNAITNVAANNANVQRECEDSNGTSPYCALFERPLPFSDRSPANFPTRTFTQGVNAARSWTRGWDVEANYRLQLADVFASVPGDLSVRALLAYQPLLKSQTILSLPPTEQAGIGGNSKLRANINLSYTNGGFGLSVAQRWQSKQYFSDPRINFDLRGRIPAYMYTDISLSYRTEVGGHEISPFMTIENLFNKRPPVAGGGNSVPGLFYPSVGGFDVIGRYFTVGVRGRF